MSYYGIHDAKVQCAICTTCQSENFVWMAETFACPTCGGAEYELAEEATDPDEEEEGTTCVPGRGTGTQKSVRKRKRPTSCERY